MTLGSLFDGISGFPLAASWCGIETKWISEIDPYCLKVSKKNFPNAIQYGDIKEIGKGRKWEPEYVDIISGGFPCQPFSNAGKKKGREDDRHLWPQMLRVIRENKPTWIIAENVPGLFNIEDGLVFEQVCLDLEVEGYEVQPLDIPACSKDARHKRHRVWFIAYYNGNRCGDGRISKEEGCKGQSFDKASSQIDAYSYSIGIQRILQKEISRLKGITWGQTEQQLKDSFRRSDTFEPKLCRTLHGLPFGVDRVRALGNAIVPQVAYEIFKTIKIIDGCIKEYYYNS
jgi:DNA (cytosine-5)-methyltransferase 1